MNRQMLIPFLGYRGGMGRTHAILEVAQQLASWGRKVLVVDLDFASPAVGIYLGLSDDAPGTANFLARQGRNRTARLYRDTHPVPPDLFRKDYITSTSRGFDVLPIGRFTDVKRATERVVNSKTPLAELYRVLREQPYEFILIDMPAGNPALVPTSLRQFVTASDLLCTFVTVGREHQQYMHMIRVLKPLPPVLWVAALVSLEDEGQMDQWLIQAGAEYAATLPWVTALASPFTTKWADSRFLAGYRQLATGLVDLTSLTAQHAEAEPVPERVVETAITALEGTRGIPPTVLTSRLSAFTNPRALVVTGRHGAGRSALATASGGPFEEVPREKLTQLIQEGNSNADEWERTWIHAWQSAMGSALWLWPVYDDLDIQLHDALGWSQSLEAIRGLLRAAIYMRETHGERWQARILLLPGTVHAAGVRMKSRQIRTITWTKPELLEMALQRAVQCAPEFGNYLGTRNRSRLFSREFLRHEDWTRPELESVASILFGPQGLTVWNDTLPGPYESDLVPGEAADLLAQAMRNARRMDSKAGVLIPPKALRETLHHYATHRLDTLLDRVSDGIEARLLLTNPRLLEQVAPDSFIVAEMLNHGLLIWSNDEERALLVPPSVKLALAAQ